MLISGSVFGIRIRILKAPEYGSGSTVRRGCEVISCIFCWTGLVRSRTENRWDSPRWSRPITGLLGRQSRTPLLTWGNLHSFQRGEPFILNWGNLHYFQRGEPFILTWGNLHSFQRGEPFILTWGNLHSFLPWGTCTLSDVGNLSFFPT